MILFVAGVVGVALTGLTLWVLRNKQQAPASTARHCRCSECGQKMRFAAAKTGRHGRCPRCGHQELLVERATSETEPQPTRFSEQRWLRLTVTRSGR
jgi:DNA-directed RNA polymerase subunit RPC12/RpoP